MTERYDPYPKRNLVRVDNVNRISGIKLEDIPETSPGYAPGYAIVYHDWPNDMFLMKKRDGLSHDEIFRMCDILLAEKNIKPSQPKPIEE